MRLIIRFCLILIYRRTEAILQCLGQSTDLAKKVALNKGKPIRLSKVATYDFFSSIVIKNSIITKLIPFFAQTLGIMV